MKKLVGLLMAAAVTVSSFCVSALASETATALNASSSGTQWDAVAPNEIFTVKDGGDTGVYGNFKVLWDDSKLYVMITVKGDTTPSDKDGVELAISSNNSMLSDGYNEEEDFNVAIDKTAVKFERGNKDIFESAIKHKYNATADGFTLLVQVQASALGGLADGKVMGIEVQINDYDEDSRAAAYGWADFENSSWKQTSALGTLTLSSESLAGPETTNSETAETEVEPAGTAANEEVTEPAETAAEKEVPATGDATVTNLAFVLFLSSSASLLLLYFRKKVNF